MSATTDTPPDAGMPAEAPLPPLSSTGFARWLWRQLTSMRTALILLFLLAVASIPGSFFPQRGTNPLRVDQWLDENPTTGPILDSLGFFDVYAAPWFAAVYLLLFISLIGCVIPRIGVHLRAMRTPPPAAPRRLERLPAHARLVIDAPADEVLARAERELRSRRWRVRAQPGEWVAAEKGYLRETGNLVFHVALIAVLIGVAVGGQLGWKGNVVVREGTGFSNTLTQYDAWGAGRFMDPDRLAPFSFTLEDFRVDFERSEAQRGSPRLFEADLVYRSAPGAEEERTTIEVNEPLVADGAKVFLVGHGYAPRFVIRDTAGEVVFDDTVVFLPQDGNFTSTGVIKVPDAPVPLGISGIFAPTAALTEERGPHSVFPGPDYPAVFLSAFTGDLGLDDGSPQSVYSLDTDGMEQVGLESLLPGDVWTIDGVGSIEFADLERWASFQIAHDPGKELALIASVMAMVGLMLSLFVRRRRIWVRVGPVDDGGTLAEIGALAKNEAVELESDVSELALAIQGHDAQR